MSNPTETPAPAPATAPATEDRTVAILAYITIIGFIIAIVMHSSKKTALGAYHLRQTLGLFITAVVAWIGCMIIAFVPLVNLIMVLVGPLVALGLFVLWIMGLINAVNGRQQPLPLLGEQYVKWFAGAFV